MTWRMYYKDSQFGPGQSAPLASKNAIKLAKDKGVSLSEIGPGTGKGGKITIADVKDFINKKRELTMSALLNNYRRLQKTKSAFCAGKKTKAQVKSAATAYVKSAVKAGQTKTEAQKKANRVLTKGCSSSNYIAKKKKRTTRRKRK